MGCATASAVDSSSTIWLESARFQSGPRSSGAIVSPYGRWRAFSTMPPATTASGVPPEAIVAIARNCAPPAKTSSDIAHVIGERDAARAREHAEREPDQGGGDGEDERRAPHAMSSSLATRAMVPVGATLAAMRSSADMAVLGARIRTLDPAQPWATAVAWRGGTIVAVGDDAAVRAACDARTETIDGRGLALVPGLVDAHQHPLMGADETVGADLAGLTTHRRPCAPRSRPSTRAAARGGGSRGHSLEYATFDGVELSGELVADAVGGAPALLTFFDFHTALATPAALAAAGIDGPRALEGSAEIVCRDGRPTGALLEPPAFEPVLRVMPQPTHDERRQRRADACGAWPRPA